MYVASRSDQRMSETNAYAAMLSTRVLQLLITVLLTTTNVSYHWLVTSRASNVSPRRPSFPWLAVECSRTRTPQQTVA